MEHQGEIAALVAAFLWTCSSMLWGKINLPAMVLNAGKNIVGVVLVGLHLFVFSISSQNPQLTFNADSWKWLAISGLVGVVIGDTLYFRSLQILGPRRALVLACLSPLFAAIAQRWFLENPIGNFALTGILMTVGGVIVVVLDRKANQEVPGLIPGKLQVGIACGILGALCQAAGGLFSQRGMESCGALEATLIRLLVAAIVTVAWLSSRSKYRQLIGNSLKIEYLKFLIPASALGTWLGIWFSQIAYKFSDLSVAQTLLSTCPLFAIAMMWVLYRQRVNALAWARTLVAIVGIWLTFEFK